MNSKLFSFPTTDATYSIYLTMLWHDSFCFLISQHFPRQIYYLKTITLLSLKTTHPKMPYTFITATNRGDLVLALREETGPSGALLLQAEGGR